MWHPYLRFDKMQKTLMTAALLTALVSPLSASATEWTGSGELGIAFARGNSESETINTRLNLTGRADPWTYTFTVGGLRAKGETITVDSGTGAISRTSNTNANRYDLGGKAARRIGERVFLYGSGRYDKDDFAASRWQFSTTVGVGYEFIKNDRTTLTSEVGIGWRRSQPTDVFVTVPPPPRFVRPDRDDSTIGRLGVDFTQKLGESTDIVNKLVVESGGGKTFAQNDLGVVAKVNERFALRTGFQLRYNSDTPPGVTKTDRLLTTNVVVSF
jgi:putative salt-induced outer membrane protein